MFFFVDSLSSESHRGSKELEFQMDLSANRYSTRYSFQNKG